MTASRVLRSRCASLESGNRQRQRSHRTVAAPRTWRRALRASTRMPRRRARAIACAATCSSATRRQSTRRVRRASRRTGSARRVRRATRATAVRRRRNALQATPPHWVRVRACHALQAHLRRWAAPHVQHAWQDTTLALRVGSAHRAPKARTLPMALLIARYGAPAPSERVC